MVQTPVRSSRGGGRRRVKTFSIVIYWKSQTSLRKHEQNIQHTLTSLPILGHQLGKSLPRNNRCDDPLDDLQLQQRADLRNFELNARHTSCACRWLRHEQKGYDLLYTRKLLVPRKNFSKRKEKLVKDNGSGDSMIFLLVSWSSRPRQYSSLLPFHEAQAWSAAALHALYHYSDKTGPFTQSKKGYWGIWQTNFASLWHAFIDDSVAKRFKNSNGCHETGRGRHFSKRPGPQCAWQTCGP